MSSSHTTIPRTPRVISPSPTLSESGARDSYFAPVTRSAARSSRNATPTIPEVPNGSPDPDQRSRTRSRSPILQSKTAKIAPLTTGSTATTMKPTRRKAEVSQMNGETNGHLEIPDNKKYWRELSRSPSPLGLIPIHMSFRLFIHRHEIPRKVLHTSIGFITTFLYVKGAQTNQIHPVLLAALIPIASIDLIRHRFPSFNRLYIRLMGALMRESEVDGYNGVIWYLLGTWLTLRFFPKDVGVMGVLLLSWCDTAASTFGRLWGRYTPRIRKGKSLAGSLAAMLIGIATAVWFWGYLAPSIEASGGYDKGVIPFAYQGTLSLPANVKELLGWTGDQGTITGGVALAIVSLWTGFVASASEAVDLFGWDDNLTIPVLSAAGLYGFLKLFGSAV